MSIVNGTVTTKTEGGVTYGISISDLQKATNSAKRDLMLLHCESVNGLGISAEEDGITNGTQTIKSAFSLKGMPLPNGWSRVNNISRMKGDLIVSDDYSKVAKPRWNLWADGVNFGKLVMKDGNNNYHFQYNIFYPYNGAGMPNLQQWQGYNPNNVHEPTFNISDNIKAMEFHNGVYAPLTSSTSYMPVGQSGGQNNPTPRDHCIAWLDPRQDIAAATVALGNLIDWDKSHSSRLCTKSGDAYNINDNIAIYGMSVEMIEAGDASSPLTIARAVKCGSSELCSSTSDKGEYRDQQASLFEYACDYGASLYKKMKEKGGTLPAKITLGAVIAPNVNVTNITSSQVIECERVVGRKSLNVTSTFDQMKYTNSKKTRLIFTNNTFGNKIVGIAYDTNEEFVKANGDNNIQGGFGCYLFVFDNSTRQFSTANLGAVVELTSTDSNGNILMYSRRIVDIVKRDSIADMTSRWNESESTPWSGLKYGGVQIANSDVYVLQVKNSDMQSDRQIGENTTAVVTLYDKATQNPYDVWAVAYYYNKNASGTPVKSGADSRCLVNTTNTLGDIYWLKSKYTNGMPIIDRGSNTEVLVTKTFDFLRYSASDGTEIVENISNFVGKKVRIYRGLDDNDYKEGTLSGDSSSVSCQIAGWYAGNTIGTSISWGDIRSLALKDGTFVSSHNVYTLTVSNLAVRANDIYRVTIIG